VADFSRGDEMQRKVEGQVNRAGGVREKGAGGVIEKRAGGVREERAGGVREKRALDKSLPTSQLRDTLAVVRPTTTPKELAVGALRARDQNRQREKRLNVSLNAPHARVAPHSRLAQVAELPIAVTCAQPAATCDPRPAQWTYSQT
jgi:hypothetical protein